LPPATLPESTDMEALARSLPLLLNVAIAALVFALGLNARASDVTFLWRKPGLLLRSLVAMDVVVPVAAVLLLLAVGLPRPVAIGILAMAVSPGAPFAPQKELKLVVASPTCTACWSR
jgi:BASS family bile acid:Na+ symporter